MKVKRKSFLFILVFILMETLILFHFNQNWIQCGPSQPSICLSHLQIIDLWLMGVIALIALLYSLVIRFLRKEN
jgi:hypothetical protein